MNQLEELLTQAHRRWIESRRGQGMADGHHRGQPRSDQELLGMYLVSRSRGANLLLDVGPDKRDLIPDQYADALMRLRKNVEKTFGSFR